MSQAQIAEYESLREEHMKNMEIRGTLTNIMVATFAAVFGLGSWYGPAAHLFFFLPAITGVWAYVIYHGYEVFFAIDCYLSVLERQLSMGWTASAPPRPPLVAYVLVLLATPPSAFYFVYALQGVDLGAIVLLLQTRSLQSLGWFAFLFGAVLDIGLSVAFIRLWLKFRSFPGSCRKEDSGNRFAALIPYLALLGIVAVALIATIVMRIVWVGIAFVFGCLAIASLFHYCHIQKELPQLSHPDSIGFKQLNSLSKWIVILEVVGFFVACLAALVDGGLISA